MLKIMYWVTELCASLQFPQSPTGIVQTRIHPSVTLPTNTSLRAVILFYELPKRQEKRDTYTD